MKAILINQVNFGKCFSFIVACFSAFSCQVLVFMIGLLLVSEPVISQQGKDNGEVQAFINKTEQIYGVDDELINGYPYRAPHHMIQFHPYFQQEGWQYGTLYMNGEIFRNKQVKYDLVEDAMILKADLQDGVTKLIHLNSLHVDSVRMANQLFVHSRKYFPADSIDTYYQEIFDAENGKLAFLIHHSKKFHSQYTGIAPKGRFSDVNSERLLIRNGKTYKVNRRRSFLKVFEREQRRKLRKFLSRKDFHYRKASPQQLYQLMKFYSSKIMK